MWSAGNRWLLRGQHDVGWMFSLINLPQNWLSSLGWQICVTKMSTRSCQGTDSVIKPLDTIPEDKKVRVQRTQSGFDPFEKPTSQVKRVHSENNACINQAKSSSSGKESPKLRRHSSPSSVSAQPPSASSVECFGEPPHRGEKISPGI